MNDIKDTIVDIFHELGKDLTFRFFEICEVPFVMEYDTPLFSEGALLKEHFDMMLEFSTSPGKFPYTFYWTYIYFLIYEEPEQVLEKLLKFKDLEVFS